MIVLHTTKYGDSSLIVHGYTREGGRESFLLRGVSGKQSGRGSRHSTALLHPLSLLEVTSSDNPVGSLRYLKEFTPQARLDTIRCDMRKTAVTLFVGEFLYKCLRESTPDPEMYEFIRNAVLALEHTDGTCANFHIWFLIHFARVAGISPVKGFENEYDPFDPRGKESIRTLSMMTFDEAMNYPMNGALRTAISRELVSYIGYHLGMHLHILSADVLHAIFV